jgi:hypothetical protein
MDDPSPQDLPWEQRPGEPSRWYARFERYRLAGPNRSLLGTLNAERQDKGLKKRRSAPKPWVVIAKRWRWKERSQAWDAEERRQVRAARAKEIDETNRRHIQDAKAVRATAIQRLKSFNPEDLSATDAVRFLIQATKLERTVLGNPEAGAEEPQSPTTADTVDFTLEDAVRANQELEKWHHDSLQPQRRPPLP